jgi:hypothetical protein
MLAVSMCAMASSALPERRALILYGRVGTYQTRTASMKKGVPGDSQLWQTCAESITQHVLRPWREAGPVDVFVQSWSPELAPLMDAHWKPAASDHELQNTTLKCPPPRLPYCDRTQWALLGMKRAAALRTRWAAAAPGRAHATVMMMRHDVHWYSPMPAVSASGAVKLWLALDCTFAACHTAGTLSSAAPLALAHASPH